MITPLSPRISPSAAESADPVAEGSPGWHRKHVMPATGGVGAGGLKRGRIEVAAQDLGQLVGVIHVERDGTGSAAVQRDIVVGAGEPGGDLFGSRLDWACQWSPTTVPGCLVPRLTGSTYQPCSA